MAVLVRRGPSWSETNKAMDTENGAGHFEIKLQEFRAHAA